jgi:peptide/nickel transport system permease protein
LIAPYKFNEQRATDARQPPSPQHWFGTDHLGRDVFSRVVLGAGEVIGLAGSATLLAVVGGIFFGLISGYRGGWLDEILMRIFDSILALPAMLLALLFLGIWGTSQFSVLLVIAVAFTPIVARVVRSVVLSVKSKGFIEIAQTQGESHWWILGKEIFPFFYPHFLWKPLFAFPMPFFSRLIRFF